jgi:hypothetical protein
MIDYFRVIVHLEPPVKMVSENPILPQAPLSLTTFACTPFNHSLPALEQSLDFSDDELDKIENILG